MTTDIAIVASQYAEALMQLACESTDSNTARNIHDDLQLVAEVIRLTPEFKILLGDPGVSPTEKKQLLINTFKDKIHDYTLRLLELLADRRRLNLTSHIAIGYERLWREKQNLVSGMLFYAEKPDQRTLEEIKTRLGHKLGKTVLLTEKEDKSLIGGYVLRIGDQLIDGSLKGRLQSIETELLSV